MNYTVRLLDDSSIKIEGVNNIVENDDNFIFVDKNEGTLAIVGKQQYKYFVKNKDKNTVPSFGSGGFLANAAASPFAD